MERGKRERDRERASRYAKQGLGRPSRRAEMRCQRCAGALMYECGENQTRHSTDRRGREGEGDGGVQLYRGAKVPPSFFF